jgi:hypothetical protein
MALEGFQFPSSARRFWCLLTDLADKPDHEREIDGAMHSSGLEYAVARPIPMSGNRVMSSAWRMTSPTRVGASDSITDCAPSWAIATYRADIAAFFEALDRETDPVLIARQRTSGRYSRAWKRPTMV